MLVGDKILSAILFVLLLPSLSSAAPSSAVPAGSRTGLEVGDRVTVASCKANLRSAPTIEPGNILAVLVRGSTGLITVIGTASEGSWYRVTVQGQTGWIHASVCAPQAPVRSLNSIVAGNEGDGADLEHAFPDKFQALYRRVNRVYSKEEFRDLMAGKAGTKLDHPYIEQLRFVASPESISKQAQQHRDWVALLVNEKTLQEGVSFFAAYESYFKAAHEKTGVDPYDILAVLNWESRLGRYTGDYQLFKTFVGQYFYIDTVEEALFEEGAYDKAGVMERKDALERITRIRNRALHNFSDFLIQAKTRGFDPYTVMGSWAGAIGMCQFMPSSMVYAEDGDRDGKINLSEPPDAILSIANFLAEHRYREKGREYALKRYNPDGAYVSGVVLYSDRFRANATSRPLPPLSADAPQ